MNVKPYTPASIILFFNWIGFDKPLQRLSSGLQSSSLCNLIVGQLISIPRVLQMLNMAINFLVIEDLSHFYAFNAMVVVVRLPGVFVLKRAGNVDHMMKLYNMGVYK